MADQPLVLVRPVTVAQILSAAQFDPETTAWSITGQPVGEVTCIARVTSIVNTTYGTNCVLEDDTGCVVGRAWHASVESSRFRSVFPRTHLLLQ